MCGRREKKGGKKQKSFPLEADPQINLTQKYADKEEKREVQTTVC